MATHSWFTKGAAAVAAVAFAIGLGGVGAAQADEPDAAAGTITIVAPQASASDNLIPPTFDGRSFKAYELGAYADVQTNGTAVTGYDLKNADGITDANVRGWIKDATTHDNTVDSNLSSVLSLSGGDITFTGEAANLTPIEFVAKYFYGTGADRYGNAMADSQQVRLFADAAAQSGTLGTGTDAAVTTDKATFTGLDEGLYLVVETTNGQALSQTVSRAMIVGTPVTDNGTTYTEVQNTKTGRSYSLGSIILKAEKVEVTKQATDQIAQVGSTRTFTITTNVPDYKYEYSAIGEPVFTISDKPSTNLNPFASNTAVNNLHISYTKTGDTTATELNSNYTLDVSPNAGDAQNYGFSITIRGDALRELSGSKITVTYDATVTGLAQTTENTATVNFSNNPSDTTSKGKVTTTENVYTSRIDLDKVAYGNADTHLDGATFSVTDANGAAVKFSKDDQGNYYVDKNGTVTEVTAGQVKVFGLGADSDAASTYTFQETKAPTGYLLGDAGKHVTFTVTVTPQIVDNELKNVSFKADTTDYANFLDLTDAAMWKNEQTVSRDAAQDNVFAGGAVRVENTKNASDFAKTGGEITRVLAAVAVLALLGAALLAVAWMRRRSSAR